MKIKLFEEVASVGLGRTGYARGLVIDGKEITTSHESVKTGDIKTEKHPDPWDSRVRQTLINRTNAGPTHCPLAIKIKAALEAYDKPAKNPVKKKTTKK